MTMKGVNTARTIKHITRAETRTRVLLMSGTLKQIIFPFPKSLKTQKQIVSKLDTLSKKTKKLEKICQQKIDDLEELKKSLLKKAFRGEL